MNKILNILLILSLLFTSCSFNAKDDKVRVKDANFKEKEIKLSVGEQKQVFFDITPKEAVKEYKVTYSVSSSDNIISISEQTSNGCIISGLKNGNCVLIAKCEGFTSYLQVNVKGSVDTTPYIVTPFVASQMKINEQKEFSVSLYGGNGSDNALFSFSSSNPDVASIESSANNVVVNAKSSGFSKIEITHPKAKYSSYIMIYSCATSEKPVYITTSQNVIQTSLNGGTKSFSVSIAGSNSKDNLSMFSAKTIYGKENIDLVYNNNYFSVTPKKEGSSIIQISHPECQFPIEVQIVVVKTTVDNYIDSDNNFVILNPGKSSKINCFVVGDTDNKSNYTFDYEIDNPEIIEVTKVNNSFFIEAKQNGKAKIKVSNKECKNSHELCIIVQDDKNINDTHYITTSQNIIKIEKGQDAVLNMLLTSSNPSDKNSFVWTVDNKSIIDVNASSGIVRSVIGNKDNLCASALITGKKEGIANIKVSHPKSSISVNVKVKVYPEHSLEKTKSVISGKGIVKVLKNKDTLYTANQVFGEDKVTNLNWSTEENDIATVNGKGLSAVFTGINKGITKAKADSKLLRYPHELTVICGETEEEIAQSKVLYTDNKHLCVLKGESLYIEVKCSDSTIDVNKYKASINESKIAKVRMSENILIIDSLDKGITEITVSHSDALNPLTLILQVEDVISLEKPYYFSYESFESLLVNKGKQINVKLEGASAKEINDIEWFIEDDKKVISIKGNGESCYIKALKEGCETITVHSPKSEKDAKITVYTAKTQKELDEKVVLLCDKTNYLTVKGNDIYVKVNVNNPLKNREEIKWECDDIEKVRIDDNYDSAYIRALKTGNVTVTVRCKNALVKLFICIKDSPTQIYDKNIIVSSIIGCIIEENKTIKALTPGLSLSEVKDIKWDLEDENKDILTIRGNEDECYIKANKKGFSKITVKQEALGIEKDIQVIVCDTYKELDNTLIMALPSSLYHLGKNEELDLALTFSNKKGFPKIKWETEDKDIISIVSNNDKATIKALDEGEAIITISSEDILNTLKIKVIVSSLKSNLHISADKNIIGLVNKNSTILKVSLLNDKKNEVLQSNENFGYQLSKEGIVKVTQSQNSFYITALKTGQCYLTVTHPLSKNDYKVLIYTSDSKEKLDSYYPLSADKTNHLLRIGEDAVLKVNTINDSKLNDIRWSCNDASICTYWGSGKEMHIHAKKEGNCTFTVSHPLFPVSVYFNIYVTKEGESRNNIFIGTEQIIGFVKGKKYTTTIETNLTEKECESLIWTSNNDSIKVNGKGTKAIIESDTTTQGEVTVKYNNDIYRTIVVYVCDSNKEVEQYSAHNIDQRYHIIKKGDTINLNPVFKNSIPDIEKTNFLDVYKNNVISSKNKNGSLVVKGLNEGVACIKVSHPDTKNNYNIFVEVKDTKAPTISGTKTGYLTTTKTIYSLSAKDTLTPSIISVSPVGISKDKYNSITWEIENKNIASVIGNKDKCNIYPNSIGDTILKVSSVYSENILKIRIVVRGEESVSIPYIHPDSDTLELCVGETKKLSCFIENLKNSSTSNLKASFKYNLCSIEKAGNNFYIKGLKSGQDILTLSYDDKKSNIEDINIVVSCKGIASKCIYMTTDKNYSIVESNSHSILTTKLIGFNELDANNFKWSIEKQIPDEKGKTVCSITGNGTSCIFNALNPGVAKIKVVHDNKDPLNKALYPLYMTVKVLDYVKTNPVYISTQSNVVTLKEGEKSTINVTLENGQASENTLFDWKTNNTDIIKINAAQNQCVVNGIKSGVGRITVSHPSCLGQSMDIIVIVDEKEIKNKLYISSDSSVVEMSPTDPFKLLNVSLVGGTIEQNTLFNWNIQNFESSIKNQDGTSNAVIELAASQNSAIVKPKNEGVAIIRVTNSATSHYLDIKVIVTLYSSLKFATSSLSVTQNDTAFVDVETPSGKTVIYESSNEDIATVSGTNKKCIIEGVGVPKGKSSGTCIIKAHTTDGKYYDELIVKVNKNTKTVTNYITSSSNVITLNTLDDAKGFTLSAKLNGEISDGDTEELLWTIGDNSNKVISFANAKGTFSIKGKEITIKPENEGEVSLIVSHKKAKNSKVIYISVEQNAAKLSVSTPFMNMKTDSVGSLSCSLTGVNPAEADNIVWSCNETSVCKIISEDNSGKAKGKTCNIKSVGTGDCIISCKYGNIEKQVCVVVKEEPSLTIAANTVKIGVGQKDLLYKVYVTPEEDFNKVQIESSSSIYATVERVLDTDKKECYIKVSGTEIEGKTIITAKVNDLVAKMNVITSSDVYMRLRDAQIFDTNGRVKELIKNPANIHCDVNIQKVRVHYSTEPQGITFDNNAKIYSMGQLNEPKFSPSENPFVKLSYGKEDEKYSGPYPYYFDLTPQSCGYAVISFKNGDMPDLALDVPICFSDESSLPKLIFKSENGYSRIDMENGIINIANRDKISFKVDEQKNKKMVYKMNSESTALSREKFNVTSTAKCIQITGNGDTRVKGTSLRSTEYVGTLTIKITYPKYNNVSSTYTKTFIINQEEWY